VHPEVIGKGWTGAPIWRTGFGWAAPTNAPKNETVILVIYGYFWLFFIQIFAVTHCIKTICVSFYVVFG
jgi:hypothetical protein